MVRTTAVAVDPSNAGQLQAWDGSEGEYWALHAQRFDRAVAAYHGDLLSSADIADDDRVLDIGCGTGQTTRDAALVAHRGFACGIDLSRRMVELARRLAAEESVDNVTFHQADAQLHPFTRESFDVLVSRTGTMFFGDPSAAFANIARAIRRGGHVAMLVWQGPGPNEWIREFVAAFAAGRDLSPPPVGAPGPFGLANHDHVRELLMTTGFSDVTLEPRHAPMWFGSDAEDARRFVLGLMGWMLDDLDATDRSRALDALDATMVAHEGSAGVTYDSGAWLVRARRQ